MKRFGICFALAIGLIACTQYTYNGKQYGNERDALDAVHAEISQNLSVVRYAPHPTLGRLLVIWPDEAMFRLYVNSKFKPHNEIDLTFKSKVFEMSFGGIVTAILRRSAFTSISVRRGTYTAYGNGDADYILTLSFVDGVTPQWTLRSKEGYNEQLVSVAQNVPKDQQILSFLSKLEELSAPLTRQEAPKPPAPLSPAKAPQKAATPTPEEKIKFRVVSTGSGFFVNAKGVVITNAHVVGQCDGVAYKHQGGPPKAAKLIGYDDYNDLAAITAEEKPLQFLKIAPAPIKLGTQAVVFGYPLADLLGSEGVLTNGTVSSLAGLGGDRRFVQISAPVQPGNSGGPVIDSTGNLIGVVSRKIDALVVAKATGDIPQNINFAIKSDVLKAFMDVNDIAYSKGEIDSREKRLTALAGNELRAAVQVFCFLISE